MLGWFKLKWMDHDDLRRKSKWDGYRVRYVQIPLHPLPSPYIQPYPSNYTRSSYRASFQIRTNTTLVSSSKVIILQITDFILFKPNKCFHMVLPWLKFYSLYDVHLHTNLLFNSWDHQHKQAMLSQFYRTKITFGKVLFQVFFFDDQYDL